MKLVDISHVLDENTPIYPGDNKLSLLKYKSIEKDNYTSYLLESCLHTGTHIDIPMHLINGNKFIKDFPLERFTGKGLLLDVRGENPITMKPNYKEIIHEESVVLLYTGSDNYYHADNYFTNHPVVSKELADLLISKKINMLGIDMPSPDYPPFVIHKALLSNEIFIMENLTNLNSLLGINSFEVIAFPLKLSAEASFVRAVCKV